MPPLVHGKRAIITLLTSWTNYQCPVQLVRLVNDVVFSLYVTSRYTALNPRSLFYVLNRRQATDLDCVRPTFVSVRVAVESGFHLFSLIYFSRQRNALASRCSIKRFEFVSAACHCDKLLCQTHYAPIFSFPPRVSREGLRVVLEALAQRTSGAKVEMNAAKYIDEKLLDELEREGLFQKISGKG